VEAKKELACLLTIILISALLVAGCSTTVGSHEIAVTLNAHPKSPGDGKICSLYVEEIRDVSFWWIDTTSVESQLQEIENSGQYDIYQVIRTYDTYGEVTKAVVYYWTNTSRPCG